jgi:urease accessory protein
MLEFTENLGQRTNMDATESLTLTWEQRGKCRQRLRLDSGAEAGLFLTRGQVLREGDILRAGEVLALVRNGAEPVVTAIAPNWETLARACYHLGNRHAALQLGHKWLRFTPDHVLEELAENLGLRLRRETAPFVPEGGAYGGGSHSHA